MNRCHIFEYIDARQAGKDLNLIKIKDYGDECNGHYLYVWDDGKRYLAKCQECGSLVLVQKSEFHGMEDDDYYNDYFPVESEEEAEELNQKWNGFEIERNYKGKYLMSTNGQYGFCNK